MNCLIRSDVHFLFFAPIILLLAINNQPEKRHAKAMTLIDLHENWEFRRQGDSTWFPATVPGTVHTDLMANDLIEDPFFRTNEKKLQWIDKTGWEYQTKFNAERKLLRRDRLELVFHGLDTYADVYLNDSLILQADNFFRTWTVDVKPLLLDTGNFLRIFFHPPTQKGLELLNAHGYPLPAVNDQSENGEMGDKKVSVFVRKPGYHFGWDWGPRLVTSGIWKPVQLRAWSFARIDDLFFEQLSLSDEEARIRTHFDIRASKGLKAVLKIYNGNQELARQDLTLEEGTNNGALEFAIADPQYWWTRELGTPYLYDLRGVLEFRGKILDEKHQAIGLRTIRIVQEPDERGSSFYVELNGVPVFSKGANYIPNDIFLPRVSPEQYETVIQSTVDANMNMLRVWGGGIYENDLFYDLCDRNGILVWQDFMFACSMYPGDSTFLESVRQEAIDNIKRLRNHPSIALWCGNNEIDVAWAQYKENGGWGWKPLYSWQQRQEIWQDYEALFHRLLPDLLQTYAPGQFYWPSSPYNVPGDHATYNSTSGDIHYWGVWQNEVPFSEFRRHIGRFLSEYGFQSFPDFQTVKKYTLPEDWAIDSEVMKAHQRSFTGNGRIISAIRSQFRMPERFEHFLYLSQIVQAEAIKTAIEAHRTAKPYCMGSLYWQINDCWPVASWSSMDYYQSWKALHYAVRQAFLPVITSMEADSQQLRIHIVSDRLQPFSGRLQTQLLDFSGNLLLEKQTPVEVQANSAAVYDTFLLNDLAAKGDPLETVLVTQLFNNDHLIYTNAFYFKEAKSLNLPRVKPVASIEKRGQLLRIVLETDGLAKQVFLEWDGMEGFFSDNYFDLLPGRAKEIFFTPKNDPGEAWSPSRLKILTVADLGN